MSSFTQTNQIAQGEKKFRINEEMNTVMHFSCDDTVYHHKLSSGQSRCDISSDVDDAHDDAHDDAPFFSSRSNTLHSQFSCASGGGSSNLSWTYIPSISPEGMLFINEQQQRQKLSNRIKIIDDLINHLDTIFGFLMQKIFRDSEQYNMLKKGILIEYINEFLTSRNLRAAGAEALESLELISSALSEPEGNGWNSFDVESPEFNKNLLKLLKLLSPDEYDNIRNYLLFTYWHTRDDGNHDNMSDVTTPEEIQSDEYRLKDIIVIDETLDGNPQIKHSVFNEREIFLSYNGRLYNLDGTLNTDERPQTDVEGLLRFMQGDYDF